MLENEPQQALNFGSVKDERQDLYNVKFESALEATNQAEDTYADLSASTTTPVKHQPEKGKPAIFVSRQMDMS